MGRESVLAPTGLYGLGLLYGNQTPPRAYTPSGSYRRFLFFIIFFFHGARWRGRTTVGFLQLPMRERQYTGYGLHTPTPNLQ